MIDKKKLPLIIALAVPGLMIIAVALSIYIPALMSKPQYDFIYSSGDYYYGNYYVKDGKVLKQDLPKTQEPYYRPQETKLFYHDTSENKSREISFEEAQAYNLDSNLISSDGYQVAHGEGAGFFPFFDGGDYNLMYLKGRRASKELNLQSTNGYYNFRFLGWVK